MYYEERIVDGVLCWRGAPDDQWTPCTPKEITARLLEAREALRVAIAESYE
ncbi:MAG: hypothetical protein OEV08_07505 [Nitrospira sp.]|nr:hypothetical protein [Nitrospira sp.]